MAKHLSAKSTVLSQLKMLGKLAARFDNDPRHPVDVISDFLALSDTERGILLDAYRGDDPIDVTIR